MFLALAVLVILLACAAGFLCWQLLRGDVGKGGVEVKTNVVTITNTRTFHRTNYVTNVAGVTNEVVVEVVVERVSEVSNTVLIPVRRDNVVGVAVGGGDGAVYYMRRVYGDLFLGLGVESRSFTNLYLYLFVSYGF